MHGKVSLKRQLILGIILLGIVLGVVEAAANVWWYEIHRCDFETNEIFADVDEETKRKQCLEFMNLIYTPTELKRFDGFWPPYEKLVNINSHGFRGPEIIKEKPADVFRIFAIGGSTTFGAGVFDNQTWPYYLQKKFETDSPFKVEVINAGIPYAFSETETNMVKKEIIDLQPDLLLVYDGYNDLTEQFPAVEWKDNWIEICELGKIHGFDTIVTLQPYVGTGDRILTDAELVMHSYSILPDYEHHLLYDEYVEQLQELDNKCTSSADLREIYDLVPFTVYFDKVHVGAKGYEIVAENFYKLSLPLVSEHKIIRDSYSDVDSELPKESDIESSVTASEELTSDFRKLLFTYKTPVVFAYFLDEQFSKEKKSIDFSQVQNFAEKDLRGENFAGQNLENALFYKSDLKNADFTDANLKGAIFRYSDSPSVTFVGADLENARLQYATLDNADMTDANLKGANLSVTILLSPKFDNANFEDVDLTKSLIFKADFSQTDLFNVNFLNADVYHSNFAGMDLSTVDFTATSLAGSSLNYANLDGTVLRLADLTGKGIVVGGLGISGERLFGDSSIEGDYYITGADFTGVDLSGRDLTDVLFYTFKNGGDFDEENYEAIKFLAPKFTSANLSKINVTNTTLTAVDFESADLSNANLSGATLVGTFFYNTNLRGANLSNANLTLADLTDANLEGADLTGADLNRAILDCINHPICN